jgi:hypothetical protein
MAILWIDGDFPPEPDSFRQNPDDRDISGRELFAAIARARASQSEGRETRLAYVTDLEPTTTINEHYS